MYLITRVAAIVCLIALGLLSTAGSHKVLAAPSVVGHVYVNDNTAGMNTIGAFNRRANGMLVPMHNSPFAAGGAGTGAAIGSQGALQLSADGQYLLAVDAGSNQISVLRIASDGTPITVNTASASISRYQILADGSLSLLPGATSITNPEPGSAVSPFDARLDPTGSFLYVVDAGLDAVSAFAVSGGSLTELSSSPTSAPAGATPFGIVVT